MNTRIVPIDEKSPDADSRLFEAANIIKSGGLVAFPTETVYGLGADAQNISAASAIYEAKGRPSDNPLIVHIAQMGQLREAASQISDDALRLAEAFWPGPLTLVLPGSKNIPKTTTGGLDTVAVRMPSHPVASAFIKKCGCMIAAPSANASGRPSPTTAEHVYSDLFGRIPLILDGGRVGIGIESTIVDCTSSVPCILRPGFITQAMIEDICGECDIDPAITSSDTDGHDADFDKAELHPKAPGMRYRHYAPNAPLTIVSGSPESVIEYINSRTHAPGISPDRVGILTSDENYKSYDSGQVICLGRRANAEEIARNLYDALRRMDELSVDMIFSESFEGVGFGMAVMNRLLKAAGHHIIQV